MPENRLVEIPQNEWPLLQRMYEHRRREASSWNLMQNYINWLAKDATISTVKFFSLNGDWRDGTFIIQDGNTFTFNTLDQNQERLFNALQCIDGMETYSARSHYSLSNFVHRVKPTVERFMAPVPVSVTAIWYHLPREKALNLNLDPPEGVTLAPLTQDNVEFINNLWPYRKIETDVFISRLIRLNLHVGAFDSLDGNLLAWCLQMPMGFLGILQVREDQRRKGLGSLVVRAISNKIAESGMEVTSSVVDSNTPSRRTFESVGFKGIDIVHWVKRPKVENGRPCDL